MKITSRILLVFSLSLGCLVSSAAKPFTAMVIDGETGETLIGASILIPGTTIGTVTDYNGIFQLDVPENTTEIHIIYVCNWGTNFTIAYCNQESGLIIINSQNGPVCYNSSGKKSCQTSDQNRLSRQVIDYYFPLIESRASIIRAVVANEGALKLPGINDSISKRKITGFIKNTETKEPLIGACILGMGTTSGTVTDFQGAYQLNVPLNCQKLVISYTGFQTQEITFDTSQNFQVLNVFLKAENPLNLGCGYISPPAIYAGQVVQPQPALHYTHPYQWLRGQLPGLIVSQAGNDPWATPVLRHQGIHSLSQRADPLWVVDGMPAIDPLLLSLQSIAEVNLARRPVDLIQYGLQAGAGVIELSTQKSVERKLEISYQGQVSYERPINLPAVATAEEYRRNLTGVSDLGFSTDWLQEVTRNAWSTDHQLSISGVKNNTIWRTEGSYQNVQGVGRNSAWQQYSGRAFLQKNAWNDRLQLSLQAAGQHRWGTQDYQATFFFASKYNPTAPIRFDGLPSNALIQPLYLTSSLLLRNYFEIAPSLDYFNPVAIQNTSGLFQQVASRWVQAKSKLQITDQLNWQIGASYQANDQEWGEENRTYALFRGNALSPLPGAAQRRALQNRQEWLRSSLHFEKTINNGKWNIETAYHFQRFNLEDRLSGNQGFGNDDFTYQDFESFLNPQSEFFQENYGETHRLIGLQFKNTLKWKAFNWRTAFQYQGSTLLGENERWLPQYATDLEINLNKFLQQNKGKTVLHGGYARLGNLPTNKTYSQGQYDEGQQIFLGGNPDLLPETRSMGQLGIRLEHFNWFITVDYFGSRTNDPVINKLGVNFLPTEYNGFGGNLSQVAIRNRSSELTAGLRVGNRLQWESSISWAYTRTYLLDTGEEGATGFFNFNNQNTTLNSGALGFNWENGVGLIEADAPFGQLIGRQFYRSASLASGQPIHVEVFNSDGEGLPYPYEAYGVIGNALPRHTYAWKNKLTWKNWQLDWLVRGELGHDLANLRRAELDPLVDNESLFLTARNFLSTKYDLPGVKGSPVFSDRYIESGNYLSLDYVSLSHRISLGNNNDLHIYLSGQNLLLLTAYTGVDPSPRFVDEGKTINGSIPTLPNKVGQLAPGIDRRYFYPRTQTFTLGARLVL